MLSYCWAILQSYAPGPCGVWGRIFRRRKQSKKNLQYNSNNNPNILSKCRNHHNHNYNDDDFELDALTDKTKTFWIHDEEFKMTTKTTKITITKSTVKVVNSKDDKEFPRSEKKDGVYVTPWDTDDKVPPTGWTNFKYAFTTDNSKVPSEEKLNDEPLMQLMKPDPNRIENPPENGIRVTWLGHASVLFQLDKVNILTNPNFSNLGTRYYHPSSEKRYRPPVYDVEKLPRIDAVLISNTHFDHLDLPSVRALNERFGEMLLWYVPAGVEEWMKKAGCVNTVEMDWWKEDIVDFIDYSKIDNEEDTAVTQFKLVFCPSQNYHSRSTDDDNASLWGSWVIMSPRYKLFFVGATGYCEVFKSIGRKYGPFHMAALPIGGYSPDFKFSYGNSTPEEAVKIHQDLLAMCSLAISWGTFNFSNEFYLEPPQRLQENLRKNGLSDMQFFLLKHGESRLIEIKEADKDEEEQENCCDDAEGCNKEQELDQGIIDYLVDKVTDEANAEEDQ